MVAGREPKNINEQQIYIIFTAVGTLFFFQTMRNSKQALRLFILCNTTYIFEQIHSKAITHIYKN